MKYKIDLIIYQQTFKLQQHIINSSESKAKTHSIYHAINSKAFDSDKQNRIIASVIITIYSEICIKQQQFDKTFFFNCCCFYCYYYCVSNNSKNAIFVSSTHVCIPKKKTQRVYVYSSLRCNYTVKLHINLEFLV